MPYQMRRKEPYAPQQCCFTHRFRNEKYLKITLNIFSIKVVIRIIFIQGLMSVLG